MSNLVNETGTKEFVENRKFLIIKNIQKYSSLKHHARMRAFLAEDCSLERGTASYAIFDPEDYLHVLMRCNYIPDKGYKITLEDLQYPNVHITYFWNKTENCSSWQNVCAVTYEDPLDPPVTITACDILTDVIPKLKDLFEI